MALTMVMGLALLVYALAEKLLRDSLKAQNVFVPNQLGKPTQNLTIRRAFQVFEDVHLLEIHFPDGSIVRKLMNFREIHRKIVDALGSFVQKSYFAPS